MCVYYIYRYIDIYIYKYIPRYIHTIVENIKIINELQNERKIMQ